MYWAQEPPKLKLRQCLQLQSVRRARRRLPWQPQPGTQWGKPQAALVNHWISLCYMFPLRRRLVLKRCTQQQPNTGMPPSRSRGARRLWHPPPASIPPRPSRLARSVGLGKDGHLLGGLAGEEAGPEGASRLVKGEAAQRGRGLLLDLHLLLVAARPRPPRPLACGSAATQAARSDERGRQQSA